MISKKVSMKTPEKSRYDRRRLRGAGKSIERLNLSLSSALQRSRETNHPLFWSAN
jgi:hypothetical protein